MPLIVITGIPSSGKTTALKRIKQFLEVNIEEKKIIMFLTQIVYLSERKK
jgi:tRNA uridine 5-carbamoylmethylation protein Kti12